MNSIFSDILIVGGRSAGDVSLGSALRAAKGACNNY